ncbi:hypothetical protein [Microtetraspora malaysiensis]|uniref:hypothetical protein n=1 Tax=Microtetraspora malaysiensis TaxID=161358 RepID=UPI003D8B9D58
MDTPAVLLIDLFGQLWFVYILLQHSDAQAMHEAGRIVVDDVLDPRSATFEDVLAMGIRGGVAAIGLGRELGVLREGALADVVVLRARDVDAALSDPVAHVVLTAASAHDVDTVVIGGVVRKRDRVLVGVGPAELRQRNAAVRRRVFDRLSR